MSQETMVIHATRFSYYAHKILALVCVVCAVFLFLSLISYSPYDSSWAYFSSAGYHVTNWCGYLGANIAAVLIFISGGSSLWCVALLLTCAYAMRKVGHIYQQADRIVACIVGWGITAALCYGYTFDFLRSQYPGGMLGAALYTRVIYLLGPLGGMLFLYLLGILCFIGLTRISLIRGIKKGIHLFTSARAHQWYAQAMAGGAQLGRYLYRPIEGLGDYMYMLVRPWFPQEIQHLYDEPAHIIGVEPVGPDISNVHGQAPTIRAEYTVCDVPGDPTHIDGDPIAAGSVLPYEVPSLEAFILPTTEDDDEAIVRAGKDKARLLEEKLARFGVEGRVVHIKRGPVVTLFEYKPDIDAKLSKIVNLADDLALALQALSIRIIAPIPGTAVVGFEVAHGQRKSVPLAACMHEAIYAQSTAALPLLLGQDTVGKSVVVDLTRMPHLLVAGATGAGKSVLLNAMLMSLLCKRTPQELKLILIDPKRLEFATYADIGHLLFPIVTDAKTAVQVLGFAVQEMESRYARMAAVNARTLAEYNERVMPTDCLPRLVLVIDELADLMMTAGKLCEEYLARLTHMARAAGIHVIVATQRPSVDVITGVIKANFPSRIALRVPSKIDSRTILDTVGAEALLGQGDMLMLDAHDAMLKRVHGAYVSEKEITSVTEHIRHQVKASYQEIPSNTSENSDLDEEDEALYDQVIEFVRQLDEVSTSLLQRKFRIGYNRAARFMEKLEAHGLIMPSEGGKARKVLK